jgi:hypothetical protein
VYRALSTSITSASLPLGLRNGNGLPVYLIEIGSMYLHSPSGRLDHAPTNLCLLIGAMKIEQFDLANAMAWATRNIIFPEW